MNHRYGRAASNPLPYAMENPLSMGELITMTIFGVIGYGVGSGVDRYFATNPVTAVAAGQGAPAGTMTEAPAAGAVYNTEAVTAPMGLKRWAIGVLSPLVLIGGAGFIGGPFLKAGLQGTGFGWIIRTTGKGLDDLMAKLLGASTWGARLYADEIRAMNAVKATGTSTLPAISSPAVQTLQGVPHHMRLGMGACPKCGLGNCASQCENYGGDGSVPTWQQPPTQQYYHSPPPPPVNNPPVNNPPVNNPPVNNPPVFNPPVFNPPQNLIPNSPAPPGSGGNSSNIPTSPFVPQMPAPQSVQTLIGTPRRSGPRSAFSH